MEIQWRGWTCSRYTVCICEIITVKSPWLLIYGNSKIKKMNTFYVKKLVLEFYDFKNCKFRHLFSRKLNLDRVEVTWTTFCLIWVFQNWFFFFFPFLSPLEEIRVSKSSLWRLQNWCCKLEGGSDISAL
jgi:hypothetical protein